MTGGDRRLQLIRANHRFAQGTCEQRHASLDLLPVPQLALLLGERNHRAIGGGASGSARIGQQHQAQQAGDFAFARHELVEHAGEADGLGGEFGPLKGRA